MASPVIEKKKCLKLKLNQSLEQNLNKRSNQTQQCLKIKPRKRVIKRRIYTLVDLAQGSKLNKSNNQNKSLTKLRLKNPSHR